MTAEALASTSERNQQPELDRLLQRLEEPQVAASLHLLLDNVELLAVMIAGLDGLARRGEVIGDTLAEVLDEARAAGKATGLDPVLTSRQLATLIPTLAEASPAIARVLASPLVEPEPVELLGEAADALVTGLREAQSNQTKLGLGGAIRATKDDDVRRGVGFLVEVLRAFGASLGRRKT